MNALSLNRDSGRLTSVKLRGRTDDTLHARQELEQQLARLEWSLPGLPSHAVLLLQRLVVQAKLTNTIDCQVREALRSHARRARRSWLQPDVVLTEAVCFADEAELTTYLVRDWLRGCVAEQWWWRSVLGDANPRRWLQQQVLARGEVLAAVDRLCCGLAERWWPVVSADLPVRSWLKRSMHMRGDVLPVVAAHPTPRCEGVAWLAKLSRSVAARAIVAAGGRPA